MRRAVLGDVIHRLVHVLHHAHRQNRRELKKRSVALVRLHNHEVAAAEASVGANGIAPPADDHRGIESGILHHRRNHGGGAGLAVRSGHGHAVFQTHQFGQHFGIATLPCVQLGGLDFCALASAQGLRARRVERAADLEAALTEVFSATVPMLLEVCVV